MREVARSGASEVTGIIRLLPAPRPGNRFDTDTAVGDGKYENDTCGAEKVGDRFGDETLECYIHLNSKGGKQR